MEKSFWESKYLQGNLGWQQQEVSPALVRYVNLLKLKEGDTLFFPLCGKTKDLIWAHKQGFKVVGVEVVEQAVVEFFHDNQLQYEKNSGPYKYLHGQIFCKDLFLLEKSEVSNIDGIFDRAALIAINPTDRERYSEKMYELLPSGRKILLSVLEYDQDRVSGPPFSIPASEVEKLYGKNFKILELERVTEQPKNPRFLEAGVNQFDVVNYLLEKN